MELNGVEPDLAQTASDEDVIRSKSWHGLSPDAKPDGARSTTSPDPAGSIHARIQENAGTGAICCVHQINI